jgi:tetratricopeptide (TPR) repeat protein
LGYGGSSVEKEIDEARAQLASAEARIAFLRGSDPEGARKKYSEALKIYRELGRDEPVAETLLRLSEVCRALGEASSAIEMLEEALGVFRRRQAKERVGHVLLELGSLLYEERLFRDAEANLKEALMVLKGLGDQDGTATAFYYLGRVFEGAI